MVKFVKFRASDILPNPSEVLYWVDLNTDPLGGSIKVYNAEGEWETIKVLQGTLPEFENRIKLWVIAELARFNNDVDAKLTEFEGVIAAIEESVENIKVTKLDKLTAGSGISITDNIISCIVDLTLYKVVTTLPTDIEEIELNKIYLLLTPVGVDSDKWSEYIYVNGAWELLGKYEVPVDLTPYLSKVEAGSTYLLIGDYAINGDLNTEIARAKAAEKVIDNKVDAHVTDSARIEFESKARDASLGTRIDTEESARITTDASITTSITTEVNRAKAAEGILTNGKVDKVTGKQLSTEDYTTAEKTKLAGLNNYNDASIRTLIGTKANTADVYTKTVTYNRTEIDNIVAESGNFDPTKYYTSILTDNKLLTKLNTLVSGTTIKTINGNTVLGSGDIQITEGTGGIPEAPTDGKKYGRKSSDWSAITEFSGSYADLTNKPSAMPASDVHPWAKATVKPVYTYSEVTGKPELSLVATSGKYTDIVGTPSSLPASDVEAWAKAENKPYYSWSEIGSKPVFSTVATSGSYTDLSNKPAIPDISTKLDKLVSGTNIKTINGAVVLGAGDLVVPGVPGVQGPKGDKGDIGLTGPLGTAGPIGATGLKGDQGAQGVLGVKGDMGAPFAIAKIYTTIAAMNADYANAAVKVGEFVMISTDNVQDVDNSKLYCKGSAAYIYITDLSGAQGIQGPKGNTGSQGIQGIKGDTGAVGPLGTLGIQGVAGTPGVKGDTGATGAVGPIGPTGPLGILGNAGATGATGLKGDQGERGLTGATGPLGATGIRGTDGNDGNTPFLKIGSDGDWKVSLDGGGNYSWVKDENGAYCPSRGEAGPRGDKGDKGDTGDRGLTGPAGITGAAGPKGDLGILGPKGDVGERGATGAAGTTTWSGITGKPGIVNGTYLTINCTTDSIRFEPSLFLENGDELIGNVTELVTVSSNYAGVMSAADKVKLDSMFSMAAISQSAYDALSTKNPTTLYIITG